MKKNIQQKNIDQKNTWPVPHKAWEFIEWKKNELKKNLGKSKKKVEQSEIPQGGKEDLPKEEWIKKFVENEHMIDPESELGKDFSLKTKNIIQQITWSLTNKEAFENIECYVSDDDKTANAYVISGFEKPILVLTKGLLRIFENEDQMVYIIGHELWHIHLKDKLWKGKNSVGEELFSDIWLLEEMVRCGHDPRQALTIMKKIEKQPEIKVLPTGILEELLDVHGAFKNRLSLLEQTLAGLKNKHGILPEIHNKIKFNEISTRHISHFEKYIKTYETVHETLQALIDYVPALQKGYTAREKDVINYIKSIDTRRIDKRDVYVLGDLTKAMEILDDKQKKHIYSAIFILINKVIESKAGSEKKWYIYAIFKSFAPEILIHKEIKHTLLSLEKIPEYEEEPYASRIKWIKEIRSKDLGALDASGWINKNQKGEESEIPNDELSKKLSKAALKNAKRNALINTLEIIEKKCSKGNIEDIIQETKKILEENWLAEMSDRTPNDVKKLFTIFKKINVYLNLEQSLNLLDYIWLFTAHIDYLRSLEGIKNDIRDADKDGRLDMEDDSQQIEGIANDLKNYLFNKEPIYADFLENILKQMWYEKPVTIKDVINIRNDLEKKGWISDDSIATIIFLLWYDLIVRKKYLLKKSSFLDVLDIVGGGMNKNTTSAYENNNEMIKQITLFYLEQTQFRPEDIEECKKIYKILSTFKSFMEDILILPFLQRLVQKTEQEKNKSSERRFNNLIDIVEMGHIIDYDMREAIIQKIIDMLCIFYQEDKEDTKKKLSIIGRVSDIEKYEILENFCKKSKSDRETSYIARDLIWWKNINRTDFIENHMNIILGEGILELMNFWNFGQDIVEFLLNKNWNIEKIALAMYMMWSTKEVDKEILLNEVKQYKESGDKTVLNQKTYQKYTDYAQLFYKEFWGANFYIKTIILYELTKEKKRNTRDKNNLYSIAEDLEGKSITRVEEIREIVGMENRENKKLVSHWEWLYVLIMENFFSGNFQYKKEIDSILKSYISVLDEDYEKASFLCALLASCEKQSKKNFEIGKVLAHVIEKMWPAEIKFGQAMHSYPNTPEDIAQHLKRLKSSADIPPYRDIWEMIDNPNIIPPEIKEKIQEEGIRDIYGWSVNITIICKQQDGKKMIVAIQRPRVKNRIAAGFSNLQKLSKVLATETNIGKDLWKHIENIAEKAEKIANDEIDVELTARQFECAEERYHNYEITLDGKKYIFQTPHLEYFGEGYKYMSYQTGEHFNDLPPADKNTYAKAIITMELIGDLSGDYVDKDRHGDNCRIDTAHKIISNFDFWWLSVHKQSQEEINIMGDVLIKIIEAWNEKWNDRQNNTIEIFMKTIEENESKHHDYIYWLQQRVLSLADYFKEISYEDIVNILFGIYKSGLIHPTISQKLKNNIEKLLPQDMEAMAGMIGSMDDNTLGNLIPSTIQIQKNNQNNPMKKPVRLDPKKDEKKNDNIINKINFTK